MDALQSEDSAENPITISSKNDDSFKSDLVFNQIKSEERVIEPISEIKRAPKTVREPISRRAVTPFQVTQKQILTHLKLPSLSTKLDCKSLKRTLKKNNYILNKKCLKKKKKRNKIDKIWSAI